MFGTVSYSDKEEDEDKWRQETDAYMLFQKFLDDCEGINKHLLSNVKF